MGYTIKIYENEKEIDIEALPSDYVRGVIESFKSELISREREERFWTNVALKTNKTSEEK